jgi:dipeptidyl-peptidase-4
VTIIAVLTHHARALPIRVASCIILVASVPLGAQDRLQSMPGHARYRAMAPTLDTGFRSGAVTARWAADSKTFEYRLRGTRLRYDIARRTVDTVPPPPATAQALGGPDRGRQSLDAWAPDSSRRAFHRDHNVFLADRTGGQEQPLTTDGSAQRRIKYGTASWVYGEELYQSTAMWWSPDGTRLAFYRFDETRVSDFRLQTGQTTVEGSLAVEAYPKAGTPNPVVDVLVHDLRTGRTIPLDVRGGAVFADDVVGHYVYGISWSRDGTEILLHRTNRRQNIMELAACDPSSGRCRTVVREQWLASWTENRATMHWLDDGRRFIWESERSGFRNYYLYDLNGTQLATLTRHPVEVAGLVKVDERAGMLWYYARTGDNYMKYQLHRVRLDGTGDVRLTDPAFHHTASVSPDGRWYTDVAQAHDVLPTTTLRRANGAAVAVIANSDITALTRAGVRAVRRMEFLAADGTTRLFGMISVPSDFDPAKRYPVLMSVYTGPSTNGASEVYAPPTALAELGFLVVTLDTRSAIGLGKRTLDALYLKLGQTEVDDLAAAARHLGTMPYVDARRIGLMGVSYGGYASVMGLLRYPQLFAAAAAQSAVTSWNHYDTIYTERYMGMLQENPSGYTQGSAMTHAHALTGRLMIYYGTADDNVHPNNAMQLIQALQAAGKSFDVQVGPDEGHSALNTDRLMEFFIEALILRGVR